MSDPNPTPDPVHPGPDKPAQDPEYIEPEGGQDRDPTLRPNEDKHPED